MKSKAKLVAYLLLLIYSCSYRQLEQYNYKRSLKGISGPWHKIVLPDEIFGKISENLSDLRVVGVTTNLDTVEAPYILRLTTDEISNKEISFKIINTSRNSKGYFFTFEIPTEEAINQIKLEFKQQNFDWRLKLEGSQNQQEWFTIIENYRILSIKNEWTDFQFAKMTFPGSKYRFLRLIIDSKDKPDLTTAKISEHKLTKGFFKNYPIKKIKTKENKQFKQTEIEVDLQMPVPVSRVKIGINNPFDYYRPFSIHYLTDSIHTEQGWKYNYNMLTSGTLNSLEANEFMISSTLVHKLKFIIKNQDNKPLTIDTIQIDGYAHELVARFIEPATYFLIYGNQNASTPQYDIARFSNNVPETLTTLELGEEKTIKKKDRPKREAFFKNKMWLWTVIILIIVLLGWFSVKMIRKK